MKLFIFAKNKLVIPYYKKEIKKLGLDYGKDNPDIIISLGGDGTYLLSEHKFPGVPKLLVRDSRICYKCTADLFDNVIEKIGHKKFEIEEHTKLDATIGDNTFLATNEITIRNKNIQTAIRFSLKIDNKTINNEMIGDGLVVSTPWGSTGYYKSITKKSFDKGIGIAFNNLTTDEKILNLLKDESIEIKILRGPVQMAHDNNPKIINLKENDIIKIKKAKETAKIIKLEK